jgi:transposase, IS30 family
MGFSRWGMGPGRGMPEVERARLRAMVRAGSSWLEVQAEFGVSHHTVWRILREADGMISVRSGRCKSDLSLEDREEISRGLVVGLSFTKIAASLGRSPSTISREVARNGGLDGYRAAAADRSTCERAARPKQTVFELNQALKLVVETWLELNWSPEQISGRLLVEFPDDETMRVVPETIYQALFVQGRVGLNKELVKHLRTQRVRRRPHAVTARNNNRERFDDMVNIADRPAEIEDRAVVGHWEGDLIIGKQGRSQTATLVERTTGFTMLIALTDRTALTVAAALQRQILTLPVQACRSITWDQGIEMAAHARFTIATDIAVYFCDPHSPWQRGTNENTNGLARQYLPKSTDLSAHTQTDLDRIAAELNNRPRKRLQWMTPLEVFNQLVLH